MISDIDRDIINSLLSVFADDTKIKHIIETEEDIKSLQSDLELVYKWGDKNQMRFNDLKFQSIKYGNNSNFKEHQYKSPTGKPIQVDHNVKDLGIIMSHDLTFTKHIETVSARCRSLTGWILRTFNSRDKIVMLTLFKALILPRIDYCSQLYSPTLLQEWYKLEGIQRRFTSYITEVKQYDYWTRLQHLKLYSIQRRYERYSIIYIWKIINNLAPNLKSNPITTHYSERRGLCCNVPALRNTRCPAKIVGIREGSFTIRGPKLFNILPRELRNLSDVSVDVFKRYLDKILCKLPDMPTVPGYAGCRATRSNSLLDIVPAHNYNSNMFYTGGHTCRP